MLSSEGSGSSVYGFMAEQTDASGLVYLRARYYDGEDGRFVTGIRGEEIMSSR